MHQNRQNYPPWRILNEERQENRRLVRLHGTRPFSDARQRQSGRVGRAAAGRRRLRGSRARAGICLVVTMPRQTEERATAAARELLKTDAARVRKATAAQSQKGSSSLASALNEATARCLPREELRQRRTSTGVPAGLLHQPPSLTKAASSTAMAASSAVHSAGRSPIAEQDHCTFEVSAKTSTFEVTGQNYGLVPKSPVACYFLMLV